MNNDYIFLNKFHEKSTLLYVFVNLFNVWLNKSQLSLKKI